MKTYWNLVLTNQHVINLFDFIFIWEEGEGVGTAEPGTIPCGTNASAMGHLKWFATLCAFVLGEVFTGLCCECVCLPTAWRAGSERLVEGDLSPLQPESLDPSALPCTAVSFQDTLTPRLLITPYTFFLEPHPLYFLKTRCTASPRWWYFEKYIISLKAFCVELM